MDISQSKLQRLLGFRYKIGPLTKGKMPVGVKRALNVKPPMNYHVYKLFQQRRVQDADIILRCTFGSVDPPGANPRSGVMA